MRTMVPNPKVLAAALAVATASGGFAAFPAASASAAPRGADNASALLSKVVSAVASQRGFQWSYKGIEEGTTEYETTYVGKDAGSQSVTVDQSAGTGLLSAVVVGPTAYLKANDRGLYLMGFTPSAAKAETGKWIAIAQSTFPNVYQNLARGLTSSSVALNLGMAAPVKQLPETKVLGQNVLVLEGIAAQTAPVQTGTKDTLYVSAGGASLPVELIQDNPALGSTFKFSHWGQVPHVSAPRGAVPYQASFVSGG